MFANSRLTSRILLAAGVLLLPTGVLAVAETVHDPHRLSSSDDFQETIEKRCTICHTRERVDQAMGQGDDLDTLMQRMIERVAILNDRAKSVLGTFWGSPVSGDPEPEQK